MLNDCPIGTDSVDRYIEQPANEQWHSFGHGNERLGDDDGVLGLGARDHAPEQLPVKRVDIEARLISPVGPCGPRTKCAAGGS